jgi:hypothetical protein
MVTLLHSFVGTDWPELIEYRYVESSIQAAASVLKPCITNPNRFAVGPGDATLTDVLQLNTPYY